VSDSADCKVAPVLIVLFAASHLAFERAHVSFSLSPDVLFVALLLGVRHDGGSISRTIVLLVYICCYLRCSSIEKTQVGDGELPLT